VAALAPAHQHGRAPRAAALRAGPQGDLHQPAPLAARLAPAGGDAALRTPLTRYLYAYGPATPAHFARWLAIPPRYAAGLFGKLAGELECVELDGEPGWTVAGDTGTPPRPHRGIRLLPYFDAYAVAGSGRSQRKVTPHSYRRMILNPNISATPSPAGRGLAGSQGPGRRLRGCRRSECHRPTCISTPNRRLRHTSLRQRQRGDACWVPREARPGSRKQRRPVRQVTPGGRAVAADLPHERVRQLPANPRARLPPARAIAGPAGTTIEPFAGSMIVVDLCRSEPAGGCRGHCGRRALRYPVLYERE